MSRGLRSNGYEKKSSAVKKAMKRLAGKKNRDPLSHKGTMPVVSGQIVEQVRQLAWAGQHTQAIELAPQALDLTDWQSPRGTRSASRQMDLLDIMMPVM